MEEGNEENEEEREDREAREFWEGLGDDQEANIKESEYIPTAKEVEEHEATHIPYRSWCQFSVRGKGKEKQAGERW